MEMVIGFIVVLIIFLVGMFFGGYVFFRLMINAYDNDPSIVLKYLDGPETIDKPANSTTEMVELVVEHHGSKVFMFFKKDDVFAGQGTTISEALEQATQRFPGIKFSIEQ